MKLSTSLVLTSLFFGLASAHSLVCQDYVNGVSQGSGAGLYIRQPPNNNPVKDLKSTDVRCNVGGTNPVPSSVKVAAGDGFGLKWFHGSCTDNDDVIDPTHKGPVVAYLAPAASNGEGNVWIKIYEEGYDASSGKWAVEKLIANKGIQSLTIPKSLAAGDYILRAEILALHEADTLTSQNSARGIQLYPSCSQITVTGSGSTSLPGGVAFPGAYTDSTPGILFSLYDGTNPATYQVPGPAVWDGVTGGSAPAPVSSTVTPVTSSSVPAPVTSSSVPAPVTSSSVPAPVTSSSVPAPVTSSSAPAPVTSSSAPAPVTSSTVVPAPASSSSAVTVLPAPTTVVSSPAAPAPSATSGVKNANDCWRSYNKCLDASQPKPDFAGCGAIKDSCMVDAVYMRLRRSGNLGRRFAF